MDHKPEEDMGGPEEPQYIIYMDDIFVPYCINPPPPTNTFAGPIEPFGFQAGSPPSISSAKTSKKKEEPPPYLPASLQLSKRPVEKSRLDDDANDNIEDGEREEMKEKERKTIEGIIGAEKARREQENDRNKRKREARTEEENIEFRAKHSAKQRERTKREKEAGGPVYEAKKLARNLKAKERYRLAKEASLIKKLKK